MGLCLQYPGLVCLHLPAGLDRFLHGGNCNRPAGCVEVPGWPGGGAVNALEFDYISQGGALVDMDAGQGTDSGPKWGHIKQLLGNRMMVGVYLGQYCINALTYFFLTWFPVYLVKERGLTILQAGFVATLPALCGFFAGVLGGVLSAVIPRHTNSFTLARKSPTVGGIALSIAVPGSQ